MKAMVKSTGGAADCARTGSAAITADNARAATTAALIRSLRAWERADPGGPKGVEPHEISPWRRPLWKLAASAWSQPRCMSSSGPDRVPGTAVSCGRGAGEVAAQQWQGRDPRARAVVPLAEKTRQPQRLAHRPRLERAAARRVRRVAVG